MVEWHKIKAEYIAGGTSYRKLAEKYGVSFTTLTRTAQREDWIGLRKKTEEKATTKIVDVVSNKEADKANKIICVADKLLDKISEMLDIYVNAYNTQNIKNLTSALKDLKEIKGFKYAADMREQEARIRNLEKQAEAEDKDGEIKVTIDRKQKYTIDITIPEGLNATYIDELGKEFKLNKGKSTFALRKDPEMYVRYLKHKVTFANTYDI